MEDLTLTEVEDPRLTLDGWKIGSITKISISFDGSDSEAIGISLTHDQVVQLIQWLDGNG